MLTNRLPSGLNCAVLPLLLLLAPMLLLVQLWRSTSALLAASCAAVGGTGMDSGGDCIASSWPLSSRISFCNASTVPLVNELADTTLRTVFARCANLRVPKIAKLYREVIWNMSMENTIKVSHVLSVNKQTNNFSILNRAYTHLRHRQLPK